MAHNAFRITDMTDAIRPMLRRGLMPTFILSVCRGKRYAALSTIHLHLEMRAEQDFQDL